MGLLLNQVDDKAGNVYPFEDIVGNFAQSQEIIEVWQRPGIDGPGLRKTGTRGQVTRFRSIRYVLSFADAKVTEANYQLLVEGVACEITYRGILQGANKWHIISVKQVRAEAVENVVGSIAPNPKVRQECEWTVIESE